MEGVWNYKIIDNDLFSGSIDTFRTAYGTYYYTYALEPETEDDPSGTVLDSVDHETETMSPFLSEDDALLDMDNVETIDESIMMANRKIPMRIYGNEEEVKSDIHWKTIWIGGDFGDVTYSPIYNETVHSLYVGWAAYYWTNMEYKILEVVTGEDPEEMALRIEMTYDYSDYLSQYQNYVDELDSELTIPSYYILFDFTTWLELGEEYTVYDEEVAQVYSTNFVNYISLEQAAFSSPEYDASLFFAYNEAKTPLGLDSTDGVSDEFKIRNSYLATEYLTSSFVQQELSSSTQEWVEDRMKNLLFNQDAVENIYEHSDMFFEYADMLPYKVKINFSEDTGMTSIWDGDETPATDFADSIRSNGFSSKFIKTLYSVFDGKLDDFAPTNMSYVTASSLIASGSISENTITLLDTVENVAYREIDYMQFLAYCHNNYISSDEGCFFVGPNSIETLSAIDPKGTYRHVNTAASLGVLKDTVEFLSDTSKIGITELEDIYGGTYPAGPCHLEPLAYRIEKTKASGDVLQNFWFFKSAQGHDFEGEAEEDNTFYFYDNQVKYDVEYTYKVYAYMIAVGYRYKFSDLALTKQLGCSSDDDHGDHGLEFYNPYSSDEEATDVLYTDSNMLEEENVFASDAQIFSDYQYIADLYLNYEPYAKIIEIPRSPKTFKVLDNPSNKLTVFPYQLEDDSQRIGFEFLNSIFSDATFPSIISDDDEEYKAAYMHGKDMLEDENLSEETVSEPRYIEIYRLSERPSAVTDFEGTKIAEVDLAIEDYSQYSYVGDFYDETIKTNQKYYYLFRVLNQQRILSHLTEIYEAELINDGGYKYTIFNVLYEHELEQEVFNNPSKNFKKLFQLQPNLDQLELVIDNLDYNESALSQIDNLEIGTSDDPIWDKTFKIRLTSKKTSRKIDLNITYRLNSD